MNINTEILEPEIPLNVQFEKGTPIPQELLNCAEFKTGETFNISNVKCPITKKKLQNIYNIPDHALEDDETKLKKFEQYHKQKEIEQRQKDDEINQLKEYIKQQNEVLKQIIEKLK